MARQTKPLEINSFAKGFITQATPLTFPQEAAIDELNFNINKDKSRSRRLGIDLQRGSTWRDTGIADNKNPNFKGFLWENAGGDSAKKIAVVQVGRNVLFYDTDAVPLQTGYIKKFTLGSRDSVAYDMAVVDSFLVIVAGGAEYYAFTYEDGDISMSRRRLFIRDTFGVEDIYEGVDLTEGIGLTKRPSELTQAHKYNLRNQTWGLPKAKDRDDQPVDTIRNFRDASILQDDPSFPSLSDNVLNAFYEDVSASNTHIKRFYGEDLFKNPLGAFAAPKGFFIIDALSRGESRVEKYNDLRDQYPKLEFGVGALNKDKTPDGAKCVAQYAGRIFYGGFSGKVEDGDSKSPRLSAYILYSQLVRTFEDINKCYQDGDPTGYEAPDLLDTDGGFIRIDGAHDIKSLYDIGKGLVVIASNGVWLVSGGSDYGFSATNNKVSKITEHGTENSNSVVTVDNTLIYWGDDGIYHIRPDQYGELEAKNISEDSIQSFYDDISTFLKRNCNGIYDGYERKVRWVYDNSFDSEGKTKELILDINAGAFTKYEIEDYQDRKIVGYLRVPPYRNEAVADRPDNNTIQRQIFHLATRPNANSNFDIAFANFNDLDFKDWGKVDAEAYMVTGYVSGGDHIRQKQVPYLFFYMQKTEDGFIEQEDGGLVPRNSSSCLVRSQWEWTDSPVYGKWSTPFQVYRHKRPYMASGPEDKYDTGERVVTTKNKLRGRGTVVSLDIRTEPDKDCTIFGWAMVLGVNSNV